MDLARNPEEGNDILLARIDERVKGLAEALRDLRQERNRADVDARTAIAAAAAVNAAELKQHFDDDSREFGAIQGRLSRLETWQYKVVGAVAAITIVVTIVGQAVAHAIWR